MIEHFGKTRKSGAFKAEIPAALAYNEMAKELFGEFAWLNVIEVEPTGATPQKNGEKE